LSKEDFVAARTTRVEARERIIKSFMDSLDRIIPPDESVPLRGQTFLDWEQQADAMRKAVLPTLLQERAALDTAAAVQADGCGQCPRCGSQRLYLDRADQQPQKEVISPHGPVVIVKQSCRCRDCGRSFSPSRA
jgi:DNA-directed RNA polymerase subunit RPC12/RpoP